MHLSGKVDIFWVTISSDVHFLENVTLGIYGSNYTRNQILTLIIVGKGYWSLSIKIEIKKYS